MPEIGTSGLMSGDGKRGVGHRPQATAPILDSTGEIGGDQQRRVLVELADQVEQQLAAGLAERQVAEFVDDDEIVAQQLGQPATATGGLLLLQLIDEIDQIEEASSGAGANDPEAVSTLAQAN